MTHRCRRGRASARDVPLRCCSHAAAPAPRRNIAHQTPGRRRSLWTELLPRLACNCSPWEHSCPGLQSRFVSPRPLATENISMAPPVLAPVMTPSLLSALKNHPDLPRHTWYIIASTALTVLNRPDEIPRVYADAVGTGAPDVAGPSAAPEEQLSITQRIREALVKTAVIGGMPKVFPDPRTTIPPGTTIAACPCLRV
jgi:hypothetical protein